MQEIIKAGEHGTAIVIGFWLPILAGIGILIFLIKFSHHHLRSALTHFMQEADAFTRKKRNSLSANFGGGLILAILIFFYVIDATSLHLVAMIENRSPEGPAIPIIAFVFALGLYFIGCIATCKYLDPEG